MKHQGICAPLVISASLIAPHRIIRWIIGMAVCALLTPALPAGARTDTASDERSVTLSDPTPSQDGNDLEGSTFSLTVRDAPLSNVLAVLSATTPLRFRYAAPPDAVVSANLVNVPLLPTLETLLRGVHWQMRRSGTDVFLFREEAITGSPTGARNAEGAKRNISAWSYWNWTPPPPSNWMVTESQSVKGENRAVWFLSDPVPAQQAVTHSAGNSWQATSLVLDALRRPGIAVILPPAAPEPARAVNDPSDRASGNSGRNTALTSGGATSPLWMRWKVPLRFVPSKTTLLVETPVEATLYVNGAPLLRDWTGMRMIDLSRVLRHGDNHLAVFWRRVPRSMMARIPQSSISQAPPSGSPPAVPVNSVHETLSLTGSSLDEPPLRYEWFFESTLGAIMERE